MPSRKWQWEYGASAGVGVAAMACTFLQPRQTARLQASFRYGRRRRTHTVRCDDHADLFIDTTEETPLIEFGEAELGWWLNDAHARGDECRTANTPSGASTNRVSVHVQGGHGRRQVHVWSRLRTASWARDCISAAFNKVKIT